jgi:hypothetical protein
MKISGKKLAGGFALATVALLIFTGVTFIMVPLQFVMALVLGWFSFIKNIVLTAQPDFSEIGFFVVLCGVFVAALHWFLGWLYGHLQDGEETFKWGWTGAIAGLVFLLFLTTMSAVGIAHQVAWYDRHPAVQNSWYSPSFQLRRVCQSISMETDTSTTVSLREMQAGLGKLPRRTVSTLRLSVLPDEHGQPAGILVLPRAVSDQIKHGFVYCWFDPGLKRMRFDHAELDEFLRAPRHRATAKKDDQSADSVPPKN